MKRYSKQQPKTDLKETKTKKDRHGELSSVEVKGKILKFDKKSKTWVAQKPTSKRQSKRLSVQFAEELRMRATPSEKKFRDFLRAIGIKHIFQHRILVGNKKYRYADFSFPALKIIIEVDGGYHNEEGQKVKDIEREQEIIKAIGYEIIRFTNEQVEFEPDLIFEILMDKIRTKYQSICK